MATKQPYSWNQKIKKGSVGPNKGWSRSQYDAQRTPPQPIEHVGLHAGHRNSLRSAKHVHASHVNKGFRPVAKAPFGDNHPKVGRARYV